MFKLTKRPENSQNTVKYAKIHHFVTPQMTQKCDQNGKKTRIIFLSAPEEYNQSSITSPNELRFTRELCQKLDFEALSSCTCSRDEQDRDAGEN